MNPDNKNKVLAITKALAFTENGGQPDVENLKAGQSGEMKSMFQFTPSTWKSYAKQVTGQDNIPMTPEMEAAIVGHKVSNWLDEGYNTEQIASMWNAGERRPDAYKENWKGKNKYGVAYDTPAYAKKVNDYATKFEGDLSQGGQSKEPIASTVTANVAPPTVNQPVEDSGLLSKALAQKAPKANPGLVSM